MWLKKFLYIVVTDIASFKEELLVRSQLMGDGSMARNQTSPALLLLHPSIHLGPKHNINPMPHTNCVPSTPCAHYCVAIHPRNTIFLHCIVVPRRLYMMPWEYCPAYVAPRLWPMVHLTKLDYNKFASKVVAL